MLKKILTVVLSLILFNQVKCQLLFYQDTYKGGITSDGVSYYGFDYMPGDSINFQIHIPTSASIKKAFLISWRFIFDVGSHPQKDSPLQVSFNSNTLSFDSSDIITPTFTCFNPSAKEWMVAKDVSSLVQHTNNKLLIPCQTCLMSNDTTRHYVYDGFLLIVMYEDNSMPLVNSCIYLNQENITPNMTQILNNFNPVDVSKDVGLSIWTNDVHSFPGNYTLSYTLNSTLGSFPLGVLDEHYIGGYKKTLAGSFYYENNSLVGLVDDTPDAFIDSTDALVNIKNYISNIASNYTLTSTSPSIGGCTDGRLSYIMAYSTPCPARNDKDTLRNYNICNGSNQQLNTASVNSGNIYTWYSNDGSLATATTSSVIVTPTVSTNYIAYVDSAGCKHTEHFKVNVNPIPKTDSIQITNAICGQSLGSAIILPPNSGGNSITYNIGNGSQSSNTFNSLNPNVYSYTVTNSAGCSYIKSNSFTVVEINPAIATFYFQPVSACVNELVSFFNTSGGTTQYWWSFGTGDTTNTRNSGYTFSDTGNYVVTLIAWHNQKQCSDTAVKTIHVKECPPDSISITAPNVFTPNGDDINETWLPAIYTLGYTINYYSLIIFDRWGLKVFESSDSKNGWDGHTTSGISCSEGTYYYVIKYKASNTQGIKEQTLKGFLQLIR